VALHGNAILRLECQSEQLREQLFAPHEQLRIDAALALRALRGSPSSALSAAA
jgi:hypothetical protein